MGLCTRCGQQTEAWTEFCPTCSGHPADEATAGDPGLATALAAPAPALRGRAVGGLPAYPMAATTQTAHAEPAEQRTADQPASPATPGRLRFEQSAAAGRQPDGGLAYAPAAPAHSARPEVPATRREPAATLAAWQTVPAARTGGPFPPAMPPGNGDGGAQLPADPPDLATAEPAGPIEPADGGSRGSVRAAHSRSPRASRWIIIAATVLVLVIAAATTVLAIVHRGTVTGAGTGGQRPPQTASPPAGHSAAPGATTVGMVRVTAAAAAAHHETGTAAFLNRYFRAINSHDYAAFRRLLQPALRASLSKAAFTASYDSTRDSAATLQQVITGGAGLVTAEVTFTSHQRAAQSPTNSACTRWSVKLSLVRVRQRYELTTPPAGYAATERACR